MRQYGKAGREQEINRQNESRLRRPDEGGTSNRRTSNRRISNRGISNRGMSKGNYLTVTPTSKHIINFDDSTVPQFDSSTVLQFNSSTVLQFYSSTVPQFHTIRRLAENNPPPSLFPDTLKNRRILHRINCLNNHPSSVSQFICSSVPSVKV